VVSAGVHVLTAGQKVTIYKGNMPNDESIRVLKAPNLIAPASSPSLAPIAK